MPGLFEPLPKPLIKKVEFIVDKSIEYQDSEMLDDWGDLLDIHTILELAA